MNNNNNNSGCDCNINLGPLPQCEGDVTNAILCATAHEQAEIAKMLRVLGCKLCKTVGWLPDTLGDDISDETKIDLANKIELDVATVIRALADKENAIAAKVKAILCPCE